MAIDMEEADELEVRIRSIHSELRRLSKDGTKEAALERTRLEGEMRGAILELYEEVKKVKQEIEEMNG
jgi:hypothetical protein